LLDPFFESVAATGASIIVWPAASLAEAPARSVAPEPTDRTILVT